MAKHLQIRNVPEDLHRKLKARAAELGLSMSDYLKQMIEDSLRLPDWEAIERNYQKMGPIDLPIDSVQLIRDERDGR